MLDCFLAEQICLSPQGTLVIVRPGKKWLEKKECNLVIIFFFKTKQNIRTILKMSKSDRNKLIQRIAALLQG